MQPQAILGVLGPFQFIPLVHTKEFRQNRCFHNFSRDYPILPPDANLPDEPKIRSIFSYLVEKKGWQVSACQPS